MTGRWFRVAAVIVVAGEVAAVLARPGLLVRAARLVEDVRWTARRYGWMLARRVL